MSDPNASCPECHSTDVRARPKLGDWTCLECGHSWNRPIATGSRARPRLFLSYGRRDATDLANRLRADLEQAGYEVWQDTHQIRSGREWEQEILDGLRSTQLLIAVLSPHAVRVATAAADQLDSVCLDEISFARFGRPPKPVVPVMAVPCEPPFCIFRLDYVEMSAWKDSDDRYRAGLERLLDAVGLALRGEVRYRSWENRLRPWDFAAFLNEKRQHFCGRRWLFDAIDSWRSLSHERALLITGGPGTGKSAVVSELIHRNPGGQVLAYHCCQADTAATLQPGRFVRSLAGMIASRLPEYAALVEDGPVASALDADASDRDPGSAFEEGILTPLESLAAPADGVRYLLVDALDESLVLRAEGQTSILDVLAPRLDRLPGWLRLMVTSRHEPAVLERLGSLRVLELDSGNSIRQDIEEYIVRRLGSPGLDVRLAESTLPASEICQRLLNASEGNFLYAREALAGVERGLYRLDRLDALPPGLPGLYSAFFARLFPNQADFASVKSVLQVVVAALEPLTEAELARATHLDAEEELPRVLRQLASYLPEHEGRYSLFHKSLGDWLTDTPRRGSLYYTSPRQGHMRLAEVCWREYRSGRSISAYALAHFPAHLQAAERWENLREVLCDLKFIEARCRSGSTFALAADYAAALAAWPDGAGANAKPPPALNKASSATTSAAASHPTANTEDGVGMVLAALGTSPRTAASTLPSLPATIPPPRFSQERIPDAYFGQDGASTEAFGHPLRSDDGMSGVQNDGAIDTIRAFSAFVSTQGHLLSQTAEETIPLARNYGSGGPVVDAAERLAASMSRLWVARDPRPPAPTLRPACLRTLTGHSRWVYGIDLSSNGQIAVSAAGDNTLRVWEVASGRTIRVLAGHTEYVYAVALTPDARLAVSAGAEGHLRVWDVSSGNCLRVLEGHRRSARAVAITPDGRLALSGSSDKSVHIWDVASGRCLKSWPAHTAHVFAVALTPDGKIALSAGGDAALRVWDVVTGDCIRTIRAHSGLIRDIAIAADGRLAFSSGEDGIARVFDMLTGDCLKELVGHAGPVHAIVATEDGRLAVTASRDNMLQVWDVQTGACLRTLAGHTDVPWTLAMTPDGGTVVSGGYDNTVRVWDVLHGESQPKAEGHAGEVCMIARNPDARQFLSAGSDGTLALWDAASGTRTRSLAGHDGAINGVTWLPDGSAFLSVGEDHTFRRWDPTTGDCTRLEKAEGAIHGVVASPDGKLVLTSDFQGFSIWDNSDGSCRQRVPSSVNQINGAAFSPNSRHAATACYRTLRIWDAATWNCIWSVEDHTNWIRAVRFSPDMRLIATAGDDHTIRVYEEASGHRLFTLEGHAGGVFAVDFSPDSKRLVSSSEDGTLRLWETETGSCLKKLEGHRALVGWCAFTPDGRTVISASRDKTVRIWDVVSGKCRAVYHAGDEVLTATEPGPDGCFAIGTRNGQFHHLTLRNLDPSRRGIGPFPQKNSRSGPYVG